MYTVLLSGGSPIYQRGLITCFEKSFPGSRFLTPEEAHAGTGPDLHLLIVGHQPRWSKFEALSRRHPLARKLILGGPLSLRLVKRLFGLGINGYLLKSAPPDAVRQAVQEIGSGNCFIDRELQTAWLHRELGQAGTADTEALTKREQQVLQLIVLEHTTEEIAGKLYIGRCTVETHRAHILHKLGVRNTAGIVREAMRRELCTV